jgi:hypothetical protein
MVIIEVRLIEGVIWTICTFNPWNLTIKCVFTIYFDLGEPLRGFLIFNLGKSFLTILKITWKPSIYNFPVLGNSFKFSAQLKWSFMVRLLVDSHCWKSIRILSMIRSVLFAKVTLKHWVLLGFWVNFLYRSRCISCDIPIFLNESSLSLKSLEECHSLD